MKRSLAALGAVLVAGATLTACSSSGDTPQNGYWATTGLQRPSGVDEATVYAVKIDNTSNGQSQVGLGTADMVIQEPVEGGLTRVGAFFESNAPNEVGPIRSIRNSDVGLVQPVNATVVASGGSKTALKAFDEANIKLVDESAKGMSRNSSRPSPYNLFGNLAEIEKDNPGDTPGQSYLSFGELTNVQGKPAKSAKVTFTPQAAESWTYDTSANKWKRGGQSPYEADNLLMFKVKLDDAGYKDPAGNPVPEVVSTGNGDGWLINGGNVDAIKWSKKGDTDPFVVTTADGTAISVPPGHSWISLLPEKTGSVSTS